MMRKRLPLHDCLGALIALKGAGIFEALSVPGTITVVCIIFLTAVINMFVGSASAKWALLRFSSRC